MYSSVTHIDSRRHAANIDAVVALVEATTPRSTSPYWFPGWPGEIEPALLDAIFSARASYGRDTTGVRAVVARWRAHRGDGPLDDLEALASFAHDPDGLAEILDNRQRVAGNATTKAEAAIRAATVLRELGVRRAADIQEDENQRRAFTSITGIGARTWECLTFLAGRRGAYDSALIVDFVSRAVGEPVDECEMLTLVAEAAKALETDFPTVEHALWRTLRRPAPREAT